MNGRTRAFLVAAAYNLLGEMVPLIAAGQGGGKMAGILIEKDEALKFDLAGCNIEISPRIHGRATLPAYGIVIAAGPEEFFVAGAGLQVGFGARTPGPRSTRILSIGEGRFKDGRWLPGRRLNGDESGANYRATLLPGAPALVRVKLYRHE